MGAELRSYTDASPCPICGGWQWAGDSGKQCNGGTLEGRPRTAWCSVVSSEIRSRSGKTWRHSLDEDFQWLPPKRRRRGAAEREDYEIWPCGIPTDWRRTHTFWYQRRYSGEIFNVYRVERFQAPGGEKTFRPWFHGRYRMGPALLYREPELLDAILLGLPVYLVEGERDVDAGYEHAAGAAFTSIPGGLTGWDRSDAFQFAFAFSERWRLKDERWPIEADHHPGLKHLNIVADRDAPGLAIAGKAIRVLKQIIPSFDLYQVAPGHAGADLRDHLEAGFGLGELQLTMRCRDG